MARTIIYSCDSCKVVVPLDELEAVQVYIFNPDGDNPLYLDYDFVCWNCRVELTKVFQKWLTRHSHKHTDVVSEIHNSREVNSK